MPSKGRLIWNNLKSTTAFKVAIAAIFVLVAPYSLLGLPLGFFNIKVFGLLFGAGLLLGFGGTIAATRISDGFGDFLFNTGRKVNTKEIDQGIWLDRVKKMSRDGDYAGAAQVWKELLEGKMVAPEKAAIELAKIYEDHLHRPLDALFWYRKAISVVAADQLLAGIAREGVERLAGATLTSEEDYHFRYREIEAAVERNALDIALNKAREFQHLYPRRSGSYFLQALIASRGNNHILAAAHYQQALELDPRDAKASFNMAQALQDGGRDMEARSAWEKYLATFGAQQSADAQQSANTKLAENALAELNESLQSTLSLIDGKRQPESLEGMESHPAFFDETEEKK